VPELGEAIAAVAARSDAGRQPAEPAEEPRGDEPEEREDRLAGLTVREREVLGLLAQGRSTREIAEEMSVSVNTVRTHVNVLLHKLGVHSRLRAVALFADAAGADG
jgi:DNA-binding NarL/FixJ family response regulator